MQCPPNMRIMSITDRRVRLTACEDCLPLPAVIESTRHLSCGDWVVKEFVIDSVDARKMVARNRFVANPLPPRYQRFLLAIAIYLVMILLAVRAFARWHNHNILSEGTETML